VTTNLPALRAAHHAELDFAGDLQILRLLTAKLFRHAIATDTQLPDMPDLYHPWATDAELDEIRADLNLAATRQDPVSQTITAWAKHP
jgi:hypothetical protein